MENKLSLQLNNISKTFPGVKALSDVSFTANPGEVLGVVGVNGAGKSTMMNILGGLLQPDKGGSIVIHGKEVNIKSPKAAEELGIAFIQQEVQVFDTLNVYENVLASDFNKWKKGKTPLLNKQEMKNEVKKYLDALDCKIDLEAPVYSLTVGEKQMIQIAYLPFQKLELIGQRLIGISLPDNDILHPVCLFDPGLSGSDNDTAVP